MSKTLIRSSVASVQSGVAKADGTLSLTASELAFSPYNKQLGLGPYVINKNDIVSAEKCTAKGGGFIPITHDAMRITLKSEQHFEFIVSQPHAWIDALGSVDL